MNINKIKINFKELASNTFNIDKVRPRQKERNGKNCGQTSSVGYPGFGTTAVVRV